MRLRGLVIEETLTRTEAERDRHMAVAATRIRRSAVTTTAAVLGAWLAAAAMAPAAQAELSPSAFEVRSLCAAPAPGYSSCLGLRLAAKQPLSLPGSSTGEGASGDADQQTAGSQQPATETSKTKKTKYEEPWPGSYSPAQIASAYGLTGLQPPAAQQTIALVDAFDDPTIEHDLQVFDERFKLPVCSTGNGCFKKIELPGATTQPGWAQEISTDVEISHGLCSSCKIVLVEASSNTNSALEEAEAVAERQGATEISNSWGGPSQSTTVAADDAGPFNHPGTVITASAGDDGYLNWYESKSHTLGETDYPAASPHVVAVGGTRLELTEQGGAWAWKEETVWNGYGATGGGCSSIFAAPAWQLSVADWSSIGCGSYRADADVSADADPYTGVAVYDSTPIEEEETEYSGWTTIGGTSVASPIVASTFALAGGAGRDEDGQAVEYPARTLYESLGADPGALHDVVSGSNGVCSGGFSEAGLSSCSAVEAAQSCSEEAICLARTGYDGPSGVGTPAGVAAFQPPTGAGAREGAPTGQEGSQAEASEDEFESEYEAEAEAESAEAEEAVGDNGGAGGKRGRTGARAAADGHGQAKAGGTIPVLSAPALTRATLANLALAHARVSELRFAFTSSIAVRVHVTLARLAETRGRAGWRVLAGGLTIAAARGHDQATLKRRAALASGRYRLTLQPVGGSARSLVFTLG